MDAELGDEQKMREYVEEKSGSSFCDVVWGNDCSEMELKYISKWAGPNVPRDLEKIEAERDKWSQLLRTEAKKLRPEAAAYPHAVSARRKLCQPRALISDALFVSFV